VTVAFAERAFRPLSLFEDLNVESIP